MKIGLLPPFKCESLNFLLLFLFDSTNLLDSEEKADEP